MEKIRLKILGLSRNISQSNAYTLVLADEQEENYIPVTIGMAEAQPIALMMECVFLDRPVMYQLLNALAYELKAKLEEVFLHRVEDRQFFTCLTYRTPKRILTIEARISDAVILAVSNACPIYTTPDILRQVGRPLTAADMPQPEPSSVVTEYGPLPLESYAMPDLLRLLDLAIDREEYETAAKIREIIKTRKQ